MKQWGKQAFWGLDFGMDPQWYLDDEQKRIQHDLIQLCKTTLRPNSVRLANTNHLRTSLFLLIECNSYIPVPVAPRNFFSRKEIPKEVKLFVAWRGQCIGYYQYRRLKVRSNLISTQSHPYPARQCPVLYR